MLLETGESSVGILRRTVVDLSVLQTRPLCSLDEKGHCSHCGENHNSLAVQGCETLDRSGVTHLQSHLLSLVVLGLSGPGQEGHDVLGHL